MGKCILQIVHKQQIERKKKKWEDAPNFVAEENEPRDIEQDGAEEKEGIGTAKPLAAALNGNQSKQRNCQIYKQHTIVRRSQRSN